MRVRVYEYSTEAVDVDVPDGLEGDDLAAAIEEARVQTDAKRDWLGVHATDWEVLPA